MIYLDNAATGGFISDNVLVAAAKACKNSANPTRSGHSRALALAETVFETRAALSELFNLSAPERVVFTKNCTEALNQAVFGLNLFGKHVITSEGEHNSLLRPLFHLKETGAISLTVLPLNERLSADAHTVLSHLKANTALCALSHVSNVTGAETDISAIGNALYSLKIPFLVDCAQSAGYLSVDMQKCKISLLALPAHKGLGGLPGLGALLVGDNVTLSPLTFGGTGANGNTTCQGRDFPESFESGTPNFAAIAGLLCALKNLKQNFKRKKEKMRELSNLLEHGKGLENITVYSVKNDCGIFSFNVNGLAPSSVANALNDKFGIAIRSGFMCAPLVHNRLNAERGVCRASFAFENSLSDVAALFSALSKIN